MSDKQEFSSAELMKWLRQEAKLQAAYDLLSSIHDEIKLSSKQSEKLERSIESGDDSDDSLVNAFRQLVEVCGSLDMISLPPPGLETTSTSWLAEAVKINVRLAAIMNTNGETALANRLEYLAMMLGLPLTVAEQSVPKRINRVGTPDRPSQEKLDQMPKMALGPGAIDFYIDRETHWAWSVDDVGNAYYWTDYLKLSFENDVLMASCELNGVFIETDPNFAVTLEEIGLSPQNVAERASGANWYLDAESEVAFRLPNFDKKMDWDRLIGSELEVSVRDGRRIIDQMLKVKPAYGK